MISAVLNLSFIIEIILCILNVRTFNYYIFRASITSYIVKYLSLIFRISNLLLSIICLINWLKSIYSNEYISSKQD